MKTPIIRKVHSCLYWGKVMHCRLRPLWHRFDYRVFWIFLDLKELRLLDRKFLFFSYNRWGVISFHDKDHGPRDGSSLRQWINNRLEVAGINLNGGSVKLLCFPRLFGFVFNPLSIWFCYRKDNSLCAVLYEVRNTFNESHSYLIKFNDPVSSHIPPHSVRKRFYVSPFLDMACTYTFRLKEPREMITLHIRQSDLNDTILLATMLGKEKKFTISNLLLSIAAFPLMTLKVIAAIHWEALKLWIKRVPLVPKPSPPRDTVTIGQSNPQKQSISL